MKPKNKQERKEEKNKASPSQGKLKALILTKEQILTLKTALPKVVVDTEQDKKNIEYVLRLINRLV